LKATLLLASSPELGVVNDWVVSFF